MAFAGNQRECPELPGQQRLGDHFYKIRDAPHGKSLLAEALPDMKTLLHPQKNQWEFLILTESWILPKAPQKSLEVISLKRKEGKRQSLSHGLCGSCCVKSARISSPQSLQELRFPHSHEAQGDEMEALGLPSQVQLSSSQGDFCDNKAWTRCGGGEESEQGLPAHFIANPSLGRDWL